MAGVNFAVLVGNVGADPEIRSTNSGAKVATFSLATSESWKDRTTGEKQERTEWHRIVVFGPNDGSAGLVGVVEQYVKKGSKLFIRAPIRTRAWEDQAGGKHYTTEIVLSGFGVELQLLSSANRPPAAEGEAGYGASTPAKNAYAEAKGRAVKPVAEELDDEIPF